MSLKCTICGGGSVARTMNGLEMRVCADCGLVWRDGDGLGGEYYEKNDIELGDAKIADRIKNANDRIRTFKRFTNLNNLCDIGTGDGLFLRQLRFFGYKNVCGIEPSGRAVEFGQKNDLPIFKGTLKDLPSLCQDSRVITMFHVIEHLPDPVGSLAFLAENMKQGNILIIETPNIDCYTIRKSNYVYPLIYPEHLFYFNRHNLGNLLEKAGFRIIKAGVRDFNRFNFSIRDSLWRLGIIPRRRQSVRKTAMTDTAVENKQRGYGIVSAARSVIRKILNILVIAIGRVDYQWVVAVRK